MRGLEEVTLARNLIKRAAELLEGVDLRALPGSPEDLRTRVRAASYDAANIAEDLDGALQTWDG